MKSKEDLVLVRLTAAGHLGDVVKVKDGYARNFLIPTRAARRATKSAIKEFEAKRAELEKAAAEKLAAAVAMGKEMSRLTLHFAQKAGADGRLFASITNADIADALSRIEFKIAKSQVRMPDGPLATLGEHTVTVAPHSDVVVELSVVVANEESEHADDRESAEKVRLALFEAEMACRRMNKSLDDVLDHFAGSDARIAESRAAVRAELALEARQ